METTTEKADTTPDSSVRPLLRIDYRKYERFLESSTATPAQKQALLDALWKFICGVVWLGWGVHPVQQACGQIPENPTQPPPEGSDVVDLVGQLFIEKFAQAADLETVPAEEGIEA